MSPTELSFSARVVQWHTESGRKHLPWQQTRDPYRVWLSEIMLQQTQVGTVLGYYDRFLERFPDVSALAAASEDEVLAMWSGLGYYSRARNLHRCAQAVVERFGGAFPGTVSELEQLPGIGRSTAGAIAAFCFAQRSAILDANVRRVLTRWLAFDADLNTPAAMRALWQHAERLLPVDRLSENMPRYTQGMMDLGASLCAPRAPQCGRCPVRTDCAGLATGSPERLPVKARKTARRSESWWLLVVRDPQHRVWLQRRPSTGIWAGMHCVPVFADAHSLDAYAAQLGGAADTPVIALPPMLHVLTHRDLHLHPVLVDIPDAGSLPETQGIWLGASDRGRVGLPVPVSRLLDELQTVPRVQ